MLVESHVSGTLELNRLRQAKVPDRQGSLAEHAHLVARRHSGVRTNLNHHHTQSATRLGSQSPLAKQAYNALLSSFEHLVGLCDVAVAVNLLSVWIEAGDEGELRLRLEVGLALDYEELVAPSRTVSTPNSISSQGSMQAISLCECTKHVQLLRIEIGLGC